MERAQQYVASLEQVVKNSHFDLKEAMTQLQEYSQWFTIERTVPPAIISDFKRTYKGIHDQITKIRGINQLLESRYREYHHRDFLRDREISKVGTLSKALYARFEAILQEIQAKTEQRDRGEDYEACGLQKTFQWFRSSENQLILQKNLQGLYELDYIHRAETGMNVDRKLRVTENKQRSLSLFALSGEGGLLDILQFRMRLREYDIKERYAKDELRGVLTHLREISITEVEGVVRRFMDRREVPKVKCLLFSVQSQEDLRKETVCSMPNLLKGMTEGEVRTVRV